MANIQDVALRAGVSTATVSHVLNNTRFVTDETREAVLAAVRELHYHPSAVARSLSTRRTRTIGMVVSDISNFFFSELVRGVIDAIAPHDYHLLLCTTELAPSREEEYLRLLFDRTVDGFVAAATTQKWSALQLAEAVDVPVVFVDRTFEDMNGPYVGVDNAGGAYRAVSHLIEDGHRRIGIVAGPVGMSTMEERLAGYRRALLNHRLDPREEWVACCELSIEAGQAAATQLLTLSRPPTALFCNNNLVTLGTLRAIQQLHRRCPDDIALAAFDDHPWARMAAPALTVVSQPAHEVGRTAGLLLLRMLAGETVEERTVLPTELIVRDSCRVGPHSATEAGSNAVRSSNVSPERRW